MALTVARFVLKHLAFLLLTLLVVSFLVFTLNEFSPGDVARKILGAYATQEQVEILTVQMGLDRPVLVRYVEFLGKIASGDLGNSTRFKVPVKDIIWTRLANTALLAALAFACIVPLSMLLGIAAGMRESSKLDYADSISTARRPIRSRTGLREAPECSPCRWRDPAAARRSAGGRARARRLSSIRS